MLQEAIERQCGLSGKTLEDADIVAHHNSEPRSNEDLRAIVSGAQAP